MSITARIAPSPSRQECEAAWAQGQPSVVFSVEAADLLTPVSAYLRLARFDGGTGKNTLLLESVEGGTSRGRYSVIALKPDIIWTCHNGQITLDETRKTRISPRAFLQKSRWKACVRLSTPHVWNCPRAYPYGCGSVWVSGL